MILNQAKLGDIKFSPEELAAMNYAYNEWEKELQEAIASGDESRVQQVLEDGK